MNIKLKTILELSPNIDNLIVIYPGRFQPMGKHHVKVYEWMINEFGMKNSYITTSNKVELPDSPFNFQEKRRIMLKNGISGRNIIECRSPYIPVELTENFNIDRTAAVLIVGHKDMDRFEHVGGKYHFQYLNEELTEFKPLAQNSYLLLAPHYSIQTEEGEMCGTVLRKLLTKEGTNFQEVMGWGDAELQEMISQKLKPQKIEETKKVYSMPFYIK